MIVPEFCNAYREFLINMQRGRLFVLLVATAVLVASVPIASAHDTVTVDGYEVTFGGADEPVITGERMWLEVHLLEAETGESVEGAEDNLNISVQRPFGNDTRELEVSSRFGEPGYYEAPIIFTEPGTYTVYVNGTVNGTAMNLSFQKQVHDAEELQYPPAEEDEADLGIPTWAVGIGSILALCGMGFAFAAGRRY